MVLRVLNVNTIKRVTGKHICLTIPLLLNTVIVTDLKDLPT